MGNKINSNTSTYNGVFLSLVVREKLWQAVLCKHTVQKEEHLPRRPYFAHSKVLPVGEVAKDTAIGAPGHGFNSRAV